MALPHTQPERELRPCPALSICRPPNPRETNRVICATTPLELALLTASRLSAGVLFASLTISIMSKCYATRSYLHHSWLGAVLDLEPSHDVHTCM